MKEFWQTFFKKGLLLNAVHISLVVGTVLNAVNQGETIWRGGDIVLTQFAFNYLVPFLVSSYSASKQEMRRNR